MNASQDLMAGWCLSFPPGPRLAPCSQITESALNSEGPPNGDSLDPVLAPRDRLNIRVREVASVAGRGPSDVTQWDYEKAKRELTGETDPDRQNAWLA
jgi:hypothetical protein